MGDAPLTDDQKRVLVWMVRGWLVSPDGRIRHRIFSAAIQELVSLGFAVQRSDGWFVPTKEGKEKFKEIQEEEVDEKAEEVVESSLQAVT